MWNDKKHICCWNVLYRTKVYEQVLDFIREDLCEVYETFNCLREDIKKISLPKKPYAKKKVFKEKLVAFLYSNIIPFCMTDKVQGIPISQKFIANTIGMLDNTRCIHHSHLTGHIIGYAHTVCNERVRENYYKIPVIAQRTACFVLISFSQQKVWELASGKLEIFV